AGHDGRDAAAARTRRLRRPVPRRPPGLRRPGREGPPVVGPGRTGAPLRVVHPGARAGPAGPRLGTSRWAGGVRRVRPGAHRLAAAPLPGPGAAGRTAARRVGRHQGRRTVLRPAVAARGARPGLRDVRQPALTTAMPWISTSSSGSHSRVTPTAAMAGYSVPASRRHTAPISLA